MRIQIPKQSLVLLIGPSGCGKSTFGRRHFLPTEVVSSDVCRGLVSDDENDQSCSEEAFALLRYLVETRLKRGLLTVVDATNVQEPSRRNLISIAKQYHTMSVGIVFKMSESVCHERNALRPDRQFGPHVVRNQLRDLKRSIGNLRREGFFQTYFLNSIEDVDNAEVVRTPLWPDKTDETGPFDIVGDIHGCFDEQLELMNKLGYQVEALPDKPWFRVVNPEGRKLVFLGDLVDRGPKTPAVLKLAMTMVACGQAICVPGNHDMKLVKALSGKDVQIKHGLEQSLEQLSHETQEFRDEARDFLDGLVSHAVLDGGKLVVAHAGMKADMQGRASGRVREFALFGETTGETDEFGLPVRYNWAADYRGASRVVYGHTPVPEAEWLNRTINIDTGCVFGGKLTALRYPEMELVEVSARETYAEPIRPLAARSSSELSGQHVSDDMLDLADVWGKRIIHTSLLGYITIHPEKSAAALEVISRFATNPKWLVYLPPTMSPSETSLLPDLLEHPAEAFEYFSANHLKQVICEEKHMGSRAVVVLCRNTEVARKRFGVDNGESGVIYTRTGRRFFDDAELENDLLDRIRKACDAAQFWENHQTDWAIFDCELMPWSAKAQDLLKKQYAPVGVASSHALSSAVSLLEKSAGINPEVEQLLERTRERAATTIAYVDTYRRYCWSVVGLGDLKLAPFHILATEGQVHSDKDHLWHMKELAKVCEHDPILLATRHIVIDLEDQASRDQGIAWWTELTAKGGEGMVVKPLTFVAKGARGLVQPAVKCRGREYLRIIYGPEYTLPEHLQILRKRGLGVKRSLALREFTLGIEGLHRFVAREPLRQVHECVFGVLAMESEPVDPRL